MKNINFLYKNSSSIELLISQELLNTQDEYLVVICTAIATKEEACTIAEQVRMFFPRAKIIGFTAIGIIFNDEQYNDETMLIFQKFEKSQVAVTSMKWDNKTPAQLAKEVAEFARREKSTLMHVIFSDCYIHTHSFISEFNKINSTTKLVGGLAGTVMDKNIVPYVFDDSGIKDNSVFLASLGGDSLTVNSWVNISHEPISESFELTDSDNDMLKMIDGMPIEHWLNEQLGILNLKSYSSYEVIAKNDELVRFPIILNGHNGASRFLRYDDSRKGICQYTSELPVGTTFRIGYTNPLSVAKNTYEICRNMALQPVENLFAYVCFFRKMYLNNCAKWEITPYKGHGLCGAFMMGEIGNIGGVNEYLNGTFVLSGIAERECYIIPDESVFGELETVEDDAQNLLNFALLKQQKLLSQSNERLLNELILQQENAKANLYLDSSTGFANHLKYKDDLLSNNFNKLCLIKIGNDETLITYKGHSGYKESVNKEAKAIERFIRYRGYAERLFCYSISENIIIIVAADKVRYEDFTDITSDLFKKIRFFKTDDEDGVLVNRFVLVFDVPNMLDAALNVLQSNKYGQMPFMFYKQGDLENTSVSEEFKMLDVLKYALENDGIVPYFQGIFDNKLGKITRYEALMRIVDAKGDVYTPYYFMNVAKKYHLYSYLSREMLSKVFDLFVDRSETVSINFSVYDINSDEMQKIIFEKLDEVKDASNIILEILEDEQFKSFDSINEFAKRLRQYGVKIAIDDFGSGYSNFLEIMEIRPDFIKIDGSIIKSIDTREVSNMILDTIIFLGERFGADLVAEFVENEDIQRNVQLRNIRYSQGYHFSLPKPFEELGLR